ncbi:MAG: preprotein translocase subunit SecG [Bdellovibrio sp.]|nr:preprotein translocase subunit SecG [Bdellovibrio sp.]
MMTLLAIIHIIACLGLIVLVLLQDSKGGGVFTSQATSTSVLGAGGANSLAQTMTKVLAGVFALTCIGLSILSARSERSVVDTMPAAAAQQIPLTTSQLPGTPTTPKSQTETVPVANPPAAATAAPATATPEKK